MIVTLHDYFGYFGHLGESPFSREAKQPIRAASSKAAAWNWAARMLSKDFGGLRQGTERFRFEVERNILHCNDSIARNCVTAAV